MISVVVPNFNGGEKLIKNLPKLLELLRLSKLEFEVIVVDDASTDDSVEKIRLLTADYGLQLICKEKNTGFGMTVDRGIRAARGEIVFVMNAIDILPESPEYFRIMLAHFGLKNNRSLEKNDSSQKPVFSVGALKRDEEDHGCGRIYFEKGFFLHGRGSGRLHPSEKGATLSAWSDGGTQALRRDLYLKIGGFSPLYKFYWEDVDLGYRAWKAGYEVHFEPRAVLIHQKTEGPIAKYYTERQRRIMNLRNQMIFLWKNADWKHLLLGVCWWPYHAAVAAKNGDWDWFVAAFQVELQIFGILKARWRQEKINKLTDDQVLGLFLE